MKGTGRPSLTSFRLNSVVMVLLLLPLFIQCTAATAVQQCTALNALNQQIVSRHYQNSLSNMHVLDDTASRSIITAQRWNTVDVDTMLVDRRGSVLSRVELSTRRTVTLFATDDKDPRVPKEHKLGSPRTAVFGTSNVFEVHTDGSSDAQQRVIVAFDVPVFESGAVVKSEVRFVVFDPWMEAPVTRLAAEDSFLFRYPLSAHDPDYKEPIYNSKGDIVDYQDTRKEEAHWIDTGADQTQLQVRALRSLEQPAKMVEFVVLVQTQGSVKLVKYRIEEDGKTWTNMWAKLVVPRVSDVSGDASLGGLLEVADDKHDIFVTISLHATQRKAIENYLGRELDIPDGAVQVPLLLKINAEDGSLLFAEVLGNGLEDGMDRSVTSIDVNKNHVILSGNTRKDGQSTAGRPFFVQVTTDPETRNTVAAVAEAYLDGAVLTDEERSSPLQFEAMSIAFALGSSPDRFVVGGKVLNREQPYEYEGRLVLVSITDDAGTPSSVYRMRVGESGSNAVQFVRRSVHLSRKQQEEGDEESLFLGLMLNMPTTPPPEDLVDDKFRNTHIGFWNVDCSMQDPLLEQAVTYGFFSAFGAILLLFIVVVSTYSVIGAARFVRSRQE